MTGQPNADKGVELGVIGRPHGIKGAFRLFLYNPASDILNTVDSVRLSASRDGGRISEYRVASVQRAGKHCIVRLEGVENRDQAELLTGARLSVPRGALPRLVDDEEFYVDDLLGLVVFQDGVLLGSVSGSRAQAGIEVLTVRTTEYDVEIPFVSDFISRVDLQEGRIEVRDTDDLPRSKHRAPKGEGHD